MIVVNIVIMYLSCISLVISTVSNFYGPEQILSKKTYL